MFGCDEGAGPGWITPKKDEIGLCPVLHLLSKNLPNAFQIQNSPTKNIIHLVAGCWGRNRCAALVHLKRDRDGQAGEIELTSSGGDSDRRPVQVLQVQAPFALKPSCTQKAKTFDLMKAKDVGPSIWVPGRKPQVWTKSTLLNPRPPRKVQSGGFPTFSRCWSEKRKVVQWASPNPWS